MTADPTSPEPPTVFLVDDDESVRRGLGRLLKAAGYRVEVFPSPSAFLARAPGDASGCILLDLRLPEMSGIELQAELAARGVVQPIVFISGHGDVSTTVRAMKSGAVDFLPKPFDDEQLIAALESALGRDRAARTARAEVAEARRRLAELTPREREVADGVAEGLLNKQIADALGIAEKTVKVHRARVMEKLGTDSVPALVRLLDQAARDPAKR